MIEAMLKMINLKDNCGIETMLTTFKRHTTVENHVKESSKIIEDMIELVKTGG